MRAFWVLFGIVTHALFALTVCRLFPFLEGQGRITGLLTRHGAPGGLWLDGVLAIQFALVHSWFLLPRMRERLTRHVPPPLYGCIFCVVTCASLLLTIEAWRRSPIILWQLHGVAGVAVSAAFLLSWAALFYSLSLTGLGYQTGWTPWWAWLRGRRLTRGWPEPRGAYRFLRHPIYASFLGLVWFTPIMTLDRCILVAVWTVYIFVGSHLKDRRLIHYVGDPYRHYQARVSGYPFFLNGPLAKIPISEPPVPDLRRAA
jgi:protein-S-isoprenylcysteine O-methyltransferase Ste14